MPARRPRRARQFPQLQGALNLRNFPQQYRQRLALLAALLMQLSDFGGEPAQFVADIFPTSIRNPLRAARIRPGAAAESAVAGALLPGCCRKCLR
jgi:hypothetical protein